MADITVGHDAEGFLVNAAGEFIPGIGIIGGDKEHPRPVPGGALQEDNVMFELNINPAETAKEFNQNTELVLQALQECIQPHGLSIYQGTAAKFLPKYLKHPQARTFGCVPDYDAWGMYQNPVINLKGNTRFAGGHVHIGAPDIKDDPELICKFMTMLDCSLGAGTIALYGVSERKKAYGRWGAYRPTIYGGEYRVPDNTWMFEPEHREWVFNVVQDTYFHGLGNRFRPEFNKETLIKYQNNQKTMRDIYSSSCSIKLPK